MIGLYKALTSLLYAGMYPWSRLRAAAGNRLWRGRLALDLPEGPVDVWLHAASVGEVKVIGYLADYLKGRRPGVSLNVTVMTRTGLETARKMIGENASLSLFPLDARPSIRRALNRLKPRIIVAAETEIWPVLVTEAAARGVKIVLVNARMSVRAFRRYRRMAAALERLLACYDRFFFKTIEDRDRYAHFGLPGSKSQVTGDMKFDAPLLPRSEGRVSELRARLGVGEGEFLFLAGSTRPGEEEQLLKVYRQVKAAFPRLRLTLVPRHTERRAEVEGYVTSGGWPVARYSDGPPSGESSVRDVVGIVDVMGVLGDLYVAADLAFVGGTLVEIGGHNILEPVWARTPVVYGPYINNVREAAHYIEQNNYGAGVASADELADLLEQTISGRRTFATRNEVRWHRSPTMIAGDYILEMLSRA